MLDTNLYPLHIQDGSEQPKLPGLRFQPAPKNSSRIRGGDLVLLLATPVEGVLPEEPLQAILEQALRDYFQSTGTITSGLKRVAEVVNDRVLERNLKAGADSTPVRVLLNCAVVHGERLYLAHSGPTHTFLLTRDETQDFNGTEGSGSGLGGGREVAVRFHLADIRQDEFMLLAPQPLAAWTPAALSDPQSFSLEMVRRRLLRQSPANLRALLVQFRPGSGRMILQASLAPAAEALPPTPTIPLAARHGHTYPVMAVPSQSVHETPPGAAPSPVIPEAPLRSAVPIRKLGEPSAPAFTPDIQVEESELSYKDAFLELVKDARGLVGHLRRGEGPLLPSLSSLRREKTPRHPAAEIRFKKPDTRALDHLVTASGKGASLAGGLAARIGRSLGGFFQAQGRKVAQKVAPGGSLSLPALPGGAMAAISIGIPLVVVAAATAMYLSRGKSSQFDEIYAQASTAAAQTANVTDQAAQKSAWENVIALLDQAGKYGTSPEADTLRSQALNVLDDLAGVSRIDFTPAIVDGLPGSVNIVRALSTSTELFLLDSSSGQVLHAILTGKGYELDPTFSCAPGPFGSYVVDPFTDFTLVPRGNTLNASLVAIDGRGNLVYCAPGEMATSMTLVPPSSGWGAISRLAYDSTRLFVLDTGGNAIWVYDGGVGGYVNAPSSYFEADPPAMQDAQDFAVNGNDLFLLHQDGHMTTCSTPGGYGTEAKCKDPYPYTVEVNNERTKPVTMPGTTFIQLQYSAPPDPSIYILDAAGQSLYHFSLRLNLQKRLAMQNGDPFRLAGKAPTAFSVNPGKVLFLAFGNKLYQAVEP